MATLPKPTHGLIDGDVVAFLAAVKVQHNVQDAYGNVRSEGNLDEGKIAADAVLAHFRQKAFGLGRDQCSVILSDPNNNWRWGVDPAYKDNRAAKEGVLSVRPVLLEPLKDYLRAEYGAFHWANLEADDAISYYMTHPEPSHEGDPVVPIAIGRDKDFKSIPGWHYQYGGDSAYHISQAEADRFHLMQTLAGDPVDGFKGCPGIGMVRAAAILDSGCKFVGKPGVKTAGKNKGEKITRWSPEPCGDPWEIVISCYQKAGLEEYDALLNARLAHLVRYGEYDHSTGEVKLWQPYT